MKDGRSILCKAALISCGYGIFSDSVIVPVYSAILRDFPEAPQFLASFVLTGGYIFSLLASIAAALLLRRFSKRKLLIAGTVLFTLGGAGAFFTTSMEFLACCRILDGISDGILAVASLSMITELYEEQERARMLGLYSAVSAMFGVLLSFFSGLIADAVSDWRYCFLLNTVSMLSILLVICCVPETPVPGSGDSGSRRPSFISAFKKRKARLIYAEYFISSALYCVLFVFVDLYVQEKGLGTTVLSGFISSAGSIFTFITGVFFALLYARFQAHARKICFLGLGGMYLLLYTLRTPVLSVLAFSFAAVFYSFLYSFYQMKIGLIAPEEDTDLCFGVLNGAYNIACFLSAYIPYWIMDIFHMQKLTHVFLPIGIFLCVMGVVMPLTDITLKGSGK